MTCKDKILSNDYADLIIDYELPEDYVIPYDYCKHRIADELSILYLQRIGYSPNNLSATGYSILPKVYGLLPLNPGTLRVGNDFNSVSLMEAGVLASQGQPLNLTGKGVTIGFIDTGIQYQNEVFLDETGKSRITAIWDQTIQSGTPPEGFEFGSEYTQEMINEALSSDAPLSVVPSVDNTGHGTAIASVAAGSRLRDGRRFVGAAPDCDIVMVKLKEAKQYLRDYYFIPDGAHCYQENDIMLAIQYLQRYSISLYRPIVIVLGVGSNFGAHTGTTILGRYMDSLSKLKSRVFVTAAGSEGNSAHHFRGEISKQDQTRNVEIRVGEDSNGFMMDLWGEAPFLFSVAIRSPGGETIRSINPRILNTQEFNFVFERTTISVDYLIVEQTSGAELIRFRFENPTNGIWTIIVASESDILNGRFDIWLPITDFLKTETYFLEPDPYITMTEPSYVSSSISVTAYNDANDSIYFQSGRGFSRVGAIKPDIAAPGVNVSTISGARTGSGIAAAITAGGIAQLFQWAVTNNNYVLLDANNVKNFIIRGATRDSNVEYPNRNWGYGRLNIEGIFQFFAGF